MPQKIKGAYPGSKRYTHEVVIKAKGKSYGFHLLNGVGSARIVPPRRQPPITSLQQNSFHAGRGAEVWQPNANQLFDTRDAWDATPNKLHPALLFRWYEGLRDAETNMPDSGDTHQWIPLYAGSGDDPNRRYQAVKFTASASSNRERAFILLRKRGTPNDLTWEWNTDNSGDPNASAAKTGTIAASNLADKYLREYVQLKPSSVLAVTASTDYWIKLVGSANDNAQNCWEVLCDSVASSGKKSSDNSTWTTTNYSPYYRITDADINQKIFLFPFDGAWYAVASRKDHGAAKLYIHGCRGKATAGSPTTLTDSGAGQYGGTFPDFSGYKIRIVRGTGVGQVRTISSNTATVITVLEGWDISPSTDSEYVVYGGNKWKEITGHGLTWVSGKPEYQNGIVYFPQWYNVRIRIMQLNYSNANDHGFDEEDTNNNIADFLRSSYDSALGPVLVRGNILETTAGNPVGKSSSIGKAPTSPAGVPVVFGTDLNFQTSILIGDNTYGITGLYDHQNTLYVAKEDYLYSVNGGVPVKISYGADASPNINNGVTACSGADGLFYITAENDVFVISGSNSYPTNMNFNLPSDRGGYISDMVSEKGWLFAAVDAGSNRSSIMRMTLQDRSWHEQVRSFHDGRRIRSVAWLNLSETRPHLAWECAGELLYQEMPLNGVRPVNDTGLLYQDEAEIIFPTMDLLNTDPKFFSHFTAHSKHLADGTTASSYSRMVALDYQLNNKVGSTSWVHGGNFGKSPEDHVRMDLGSQFKIRPRLRIINNDPSSPPQVENFALTLFSRTKQTSGIQLDINGVTEDKVSGEEIWSWLVDLVATAGVVEIESIFHFLHNKRMVLPAEPNPNILSINPKLGFDGIFQLYLEYAPEVNQ